MGMGVTLCVGAGLAGGLAWVAEGGVGIGRAVGGSGTLVSFRGGAFRAFPTAPEAGAGRGDFFGRAPLTTVFGLGVWETTGDTVKSNPPISGKGATGLLCWFAGRVGF